MTKEDFLTELVDILQREEACKETDALAEYDEWDSLAMMSILAYYENEFNIKISTSDLRQVVTVADLIKLAGDGIH